MTENLSMQMYLTKQEIQKLSNIQSVIVKHCSNNRLIENKAIPIGTHYCIGSCVAARYSCSHCCSIQGANSK